MKPIQPHRMNVFLAALATVAFLGTSAARAFTIDTQSGGNPDGSAKFTDPDEEIDNFGTDRSALHQGSGFLNFGLKPFSGSDQRAPLFTPGYTPDRSMPDH
jgi:hypothetical protein